jgi:hypothetical protein
VGRGGAAGKGLDQPVSTLDLGPTFNDHGAADALQTQHGASLRPLIEGDAARAFGLKESGLLLGRVCVALELRTVRIRTHKMTVDPASGAEELYGMAADPDEMTNLFAPDAADAATIRVRLEGVIVCRPDDATGNRTPVGAAQPAPSVHYRMPGRSTGLVRRSRR